MTEKYGKIFYRFILTVALISGFSLIVKGQFQFEQAGISYIENFILGVQNGSVAFSDVDGDGDEDMLVSGRNHVLGVTIRLYINDEGVFNHEEDTPFESVAFSSLNFSDIDGDGDEDLLITGRNLSDQPVSNLYANDGGNFTLVEDIQLEGVEHSSTGFSDIDGDGDEDLLISGQNSAGLSITKLYINDFGNFTLMEDTPFEGVRSGSIAFSDIDGDGDKDVLITGRKSSIYLDLISNLYTNDGGTFTLVEETPFEGVFESSIAFSDIDGDGDEDLLLTGGVSFGTGRTNLYINNEGSFTLVSDTPFEDVRKSSVAFSDIDGDGDEDLLITGRISESQRISYLYSNNSGTFTFEEIIPYLPRLDSGSVGFTDMDGDGDSDLILTGRSGSIPSFSSFYRNLTPQATTGVADGAYSKSILIVPNPTTGITYIDLANAHNGPFTFNAIDSNGKVVRKENLKNINGQLMIDLSKLKNGMYIISIETQDGHQLTSKLIKTD